jgi:hypothetical protein
MMHTTKPATNTSPAPSRDAAEREATLEVRMPVHALLGHRLGTVAAIHRDALTGRVTGIIVRHGLLGHKYTRIPMTELSRSSGGTVVLVHSTAAFGRLPLSDPPPGRTLVPNLTWKR